METDTLVLALGNPQRGDDGVGAAVLARLAAMRLPESVSLVDGGTPGLETALTLQHYHRAIIIDAAQMNLDPGDWRRFTPDAVSLKTADIRGTLHSAGLAEALALGAALGILPFEIIVYGVQPGVIGWTPGLSAQVEAAVPAIAAAIEDELEKAG